MHISAECLHLHPNFGKMVLKDMQLTALTTIDMAFKSSKLAMDLPDVNK